MLLLNMHMRAYRERRAGGREGGREGEACDIGNSSIHSSTGML